MFPKKVNLKAYIFTEKKTRLGRKAASPGKGSEKLFGSDPNCSAVISPFEEMNQVEVSVQKRTAQ